MQTIYSKLWRDASLRRTIHDDTIPMFNYLDEAAWLLTEDEIKYNLVSREFRISNIYAVQSISSYYEMFSEALVESFLGNLSVNIFHNNNSARNNEYASELIGRAYRDNLTTSDGGVSVSEEYQYILLPRVFQTLKTGGKGRHNGIVEAIVTINDKVFSNGKNYLRVMYEQNF